MADLTTLTSPFTAAQARALLAIGLEDMPLYPAETVVHVCPECKTPHADLDHCPTCGRPVADLAAFAAIAGDGERLPPDEPAMSPDRCGQWFPEDTFGDERTMGERAADALRDSLEGACLR
jgi:hypothetical protein